MSLGQSQLWSDGSIKWQTQKQVIPVPVPPAVDYGSALPLNLIGCDVKTDITGVSMKIERNGTIMQLFEIKNIVTWSLTSNIITIFLKGSNPFSLVFMNIPQAIKADFRMYLITNGANLQDCDETQYVCGKISNPSVTFS